MTKQQRYDAIRALLTDEERAVIADVLLAADEEADRMEAAGDEGDADQLNAKIHTLWLINGRNLEGSVA
jgi:hypothetical protein